MFTRNTHLQLPQVSHSSVVGYNGAAAHHEFLFHHHPADVFAGHYLVTSAANAPPLVDSAAYFNQDINGLNGNHIPAMVNAFQKKQTAKKDRHSKIYTSQGPRDRRVRLSIGIARKFFDLQEMLGFDKPSKTLEWLLTKSKAAIKELVHMKGKSVSSPSECEVLSAEAFENDAKRKGKDVAKESRAKARARARERTREKMCIKQLNNGVRNTGSDSIPVPYRVTCPEMVSTDQDLIQESVVIKRKNVFVSRDFSSNYNVPSANSAAENWDICAILDQRKFINSSPNI